VGSVPVIVLDTHTWVWWVHQDDHLTQTQARIIAENESGTIGVSAISCWEIAKLVERRRLELPCSLEEWFEEAVDYPGIRTVA
jgi:PIN domain nuclease of toxin-antitoxin system